MLILTQAAGDAKRKSGAEGDKVKKEEKEEEVRQGKRLWRRKERKGKNT